MLKVATKFIPDFPSFEMAMRAGFHCGEFWLNEELLLNWKEIVRFGNYFPMQYVPHFPNRKISDEAVECAVYLYRGLMCNGMVIHQPMFDQFGKQIFEIAPELRLGIENHRLSKKEFDAWAENSPGLTLDVEHLWKFTLEDAPLETLLKHARRFLEKHVEKLVHVHMPGYVIGEDEHRPMYCSRRMIFEMLSLFQEFGYNGLIVSETAKEYQNPNDLKMDVLLFETWRDEHGNQPEG